MVWTGRTWNGKANNFFVDPGLKLSAGGYNDQLKENIFPTCRRPYLLGNLVLLQHLVPPRGIEGRWRNSRLPGMEGACVHLGGGGIYK